MAGPTIIPTIAPAQFAARIAANFPQNWASPDAAQSGNLYALFLAIGTPLAALLQQLGYTAAAMNLRTETSPELDLASVDFFGTGLPRPPGMNDPTFSNLILSSIFKSAATRQAISSAIQNLTGIQPRMIEPWNPGDTGAWNAASYWDVDNRNNPFRFSGEERYTGFIETAAPAGARPLNNNPVPTFDDSLWLDVPGSLFADIQVSGPSSVFSLINQLRALGITVGVKIVAMPQ